MTGAEGFTGLRRTTQGPEAKTSRIITAATFLKDNISELAQERIKTWRDNYRQGKAYIRKACSDARALFDELFVLTQRSVAAGFPHIDAYAETYIGNVIATVVDTHYGNFENGRRPEGCGGQDASAEIESGNIQETEGLVGWVKENVHKDPIIQGVLQAREIVERIGKNDGKVFVTTQNHRTGEIVPVAEYIISGGVVQRKVPFEFIPFLKARTDEERELAYNPGLIYADGIPQLSEDPNDELCISSEFQEYLAITRKKIEELKEKYPDFSQRQEVQKPKFLVISANKIPLQIRSPHLFGDLGSAFQVDIPRLKTDRVVTIPEPAIESAVCQMQYAMGHAVEHNGNHDASFSNSKILYIETGRFDQSQKIADRLFDELWAQAWLKLGGRIFLAETHGAFTSRVEEYFPRRKTA